MMAAATRGTRSEPLHIPVLLRPLLAKLAPITGHWVDATLGAGGYAKALFGAGAEHVTGIDRDPLAHDLAAEWGADFGDRLTLILSGFADMDRHFDAPVDGVVMDLGVSSMQLDQPDRGFSFTRDGPLDMRMSQTGVSAADLVNDLDEAQLADILFHYGEERAARRIARAIVAERQRSPIKTTRALADTVSSVLPRPKPGQSHSATRAFQALRIAVNAEFEELADGLMAAERLLKPGGKLAVVSFHSIEDRIVKRFLALRTDRGGAGNRFSPAAASKQPGFSVLTRKAIGPDDLELTENPRSRSAKLRVAVRTDAASESVDPIDLGAPRLPVQSKR